MILTQAVSRVVSFCRTHRKTPVFFRTVICAVLAAVIASPQPAGATTVRIEVAYGDTNGIIDIELYDDLAPVTVMNFLRYAGRGDYTANGLFHFVASGQGIRAGGFTYVESSGIPIFFHIPEDPPIPDEVFPPLLNTRGTIAMFKPPNDPERITNEWTINLTDNNSSANNVFGEVIAGMNVADAIGGLQTYVATNTHAAFISIPLVNFDNTGPILAENLVRVLRIPNIAGARVPAGGWAIFTADVDMTFDFLVSLGTINPVLAQLLLTEYKPPQDSQAHFNNDLINLILSGDMGPTARTVMMYDGSSVRPTHYYAYGPTPDNPTPHWYDFTFDGVTGAEIKNDRIVLHFVDGGRGDNDETAGKINHLGAQAVVTPVASSQSGGGCSITKAPSRAPRGGEWTLIAAFLIFLAIRRRIRHSRLQ